MSRKHVKILKEARLLIELQSDDYVCCAIKAAAEKLYGLRYMQATRGYEEKDPATYELLSLIEAAISPYSIVTRYVRGIQ